jgi:hypothetical protein
MAKRTITRAVSLFDVRERAWIRRDLALYRDHPSDLGEGLLLRAWKDGPEKGKPKLPPAVRSLVDRGLLEIRTAAGGPRAFFTLEGSDALRLLISDERFVDPDEFGEVRRYFGVGATNGSDASYTHS